MPALSTFLKSTYLLYKDATEKSLSWVAARAKALNYPLGDGIINTKTIVECAQHIASRGPETKISHGFAVALNYAISVRASHGKERSGKDLKSDERHQYFIGVLEQIRETLATLMTPKVAQAAGLQADSSITLSNRFAQLELEEPSEEFLNAPDVSLKSAGARFEVERDTREEALLAIKLILEDYNSFRAVIRECWQEYRDGTRDLIEISVMTNTAIDLARRLEADAKALFDKHGGSAAVLQEFYRVTFGEEASAKGAPKDEMDFSSYEVVEPLLVPTSLILKEFLLSVQSDSLPVTQAGKKGAAELPRPKKSHVATAATAKVKFAADKAFLHAMLLDFYVVTMKMKALPPEDELTRGLRNVFQTKKLNLWVIFATQVYLDINYIFYAEVARGYWDLHKLAASIFESINQNLAFFQEIPCDPWPIHKDEALLQIAKDIQKRVDEDLIRQRKKQLGLSGAVLGKSHQHWKSHPVRCGLMAYNIKMRHQDLGVQFENKWQSMYYTYQLYYALRLSDVRILRTSWKDMEALVKAQPQIDLSNRARSFKEVVSRVATDLGFSASIAGSDHRAGSGAQIVDERTKNIRFKEGKQVALMFKPRFCDHDGRTDLTEQDLIKILSKAVSAGSEVNTTPKNERRTIPQLLRALRSTLVSESRYSDFDYLYFSRLCRQLLQEIQSKCGRDLEARAGLSYLPHDHLPFICFAILTHGAEAILENDSWGKALFVKAGVCYAKFMRDNDSTVVDSVAESGFDPSNDIVEVLNKYYDKDEGFGKVTKGVGNRQDKAEAFAKHVAVSEMDNIAQRFGKLGPRVKRVLMQGIFGEAAADDRDSEAGDTNEFDADAFIDTLAEVMSERLPNMPKEVQAETLRRMQRLQGS